MYGTFTVFLLMRTDSAFRTRTGFLPYAFGSYWNPFVHGDPMARISYFNGVTSAGTGREARERVRIRTRSERVRFLRTRTGFYRTPGLRITHGGGWVHGVAGSAGVN